MLVRSRAAAPIFWLSLIVLLLAGSAAGSATATAERPRLIHALSTVKNGLIAFDDGDANYTYVMKPDGSGVHRFIRFGVMPTWSPDGRKLAYVGSYINSTTHNYAPGLFVMNADGSRRHRLRIKLGVSEPAWSPNGKKIAFIGDGSADGSPTGSIYVVDVNGRNLRRLVRSGAARAPTWSPDGKLMAYEQASFKSFQSQVFVMNADGSARRNIGTAVDLLSHLAWSPDGTKIAYLATHGQGIFTMNPDGSGKHQLNTVEATSLAWSPDGKELAFEAGPDQLSRGIYLMSADGSNVRLLSQLKKYWAAFITIAWQPRRSIEQRRDMRLVLIAASE